MARPRRTRKPRLEPLYLETVFGPQAAEIVVNCRAEIVMPGWVNGIPLSALRGLWWRVQQVNGLEHAVARLETELQAAQDAQHEAEARAAWLARQLRLEARYGLMLARLSED